MSDNEKPPIEPAPKVAPAIRWSPYITLPNGTRIYAKTYGKKAFPIPVSANDNRTKDVV